MQSSAEETQQTLHKHYYAGFKKYMKFSHLPSGHFSKKRLSVLSLKYLEI